jgi:hypothetical protein
MTLPLPPGLIWARGTGSFSTLLLCDDPERLDDRRAGGATVGTSVGSLQRRAAGRRTRVESAGSHMAGKRLTTLPDAPQAPADVASSGPNPRSLDMATATLRTPGATSRILGRRCAEVYAACAIGPRANNYTPSGSIPRVRARSRSGTRYSRHRACTTRRRYVARAVSRSTSPRSALAAWYPIY